MFVVFCRWCLVAEMLEDRGVYRNQSKVVGRKQSSFLLQCQKQGGGSEVDSATVATQSAHQPSRAFHVRNLDSAHLAANVHFLIGRFVVSRRTSQ